ncbi:hypothetical protein [Nocardiopsis potens]|uniref:hypothetical protein n=1 Tax=Nocardiopsis potens TaxID=1246458 RepID=UPI00034AB32E|nr:hypothetical protein [Nocardiopsis potens]
MPRYLIVHDYGMGGVWSWVRAGSAEEVLDACAEVEVVTDPEVVARMEASDRMEEADLDDPAPGSLVAALRAKRDAYRHLPGYGELAGRDRVHLRWDEQEDGEEESVFLVELGPDGRQLRNVEILPDGGKTRRYMADWPINPPTDLYDPKYLAMLIGAEEFEAAWRSARTEPDFEPPDEREPGTGED